MRKSAFQILALAMLALLVACRPAVPAPAAPKSAASDPGQPAAAAAPGQPTDSFFAGKTIRIVVGYGAGAAYDRIARLIARHMPRHIPGNPTIIVENMTGAASAIAANHTYKAAAKDGTVVGNFNSLLVLQQLVGGPGVEYDATSFNWLGSVQDTRTVCIARRSTGVRTLADVMGPAGKEITMGSSGPGSNSWDHPSLLKELGAKLRLVSGYDGQAKVYLAVEQGEVDGTCSTWEAMRVSAARLFEGDPLVNAFVQMGTEKARDLPDVPLVGEYLRTDEQRALVNALAGVEKITRPYALPPGVPAERVATLRKAFMDTMNDPEFRQEAERGGDELSPTSGEGVEEIVKSVMATPRPVTEDLKRITAAP